MAYQLDARRPYGGRSKKWIPIAAITLVLLAGAVWKFWPSNAPKDADSSSTDTAVTDGSPQPTALAGRYLFSGTVVIARAVENEARSGGGINYDQPFTKFDTFNPSQYDAWEFDHECPMTLETIPYRTQVENTVFNCRPEFIPALQKHFPNIIANIANNHTHDMGDDGYASTVELLEKAGVQTFGNYDPRVTKDICQVVALPVRVQQADASETKSTLPVAFCAWHYFEKDPAEGELAVMDRYAKIMPVFAFSQVGVEYRSQPDDKQISIAHELIDKHDPEFVIVNSPHWVQKSEAYKGKLIMYSTGNFVFDQLDAETNRGASIDATMSIPYSANVAKWLALGDQCKARTDTCLQTAESQGLTKVDLGLKYAPIGSATGYRQLTQKASTSLQYAIEERLEWATTLKGLTQ